MLHTLHTLLFQSDFVVNSCYNLELYAVEFKIEISMTLPENETFAKLLSNETAPKKRTPILTSIQRILNFFHQYVHLCLLIENENLVKHQKYLF